MRVKDILASIAALLVTARCQQELFQNPDFEEDFSGNWECIGSCSLQHSSDAFLGSKSGEISGRTELWNGLSQYVPVQSGRSYHVHMRIKMLNQQTGALYHEVQLMWSLDRTGGGQTYHLTSSSPYMRQSEGWTAVGGDFTMPGDVAQARFYVQFPDSVINYRVDAASLKEIVANNNWRQEADARIETFRKSDIEIRFSAGSSFSPQEVTIEVQQTRNDFPFGSTINADYISGTDTASLKYQQVFYDNFQVATIENALKWHVMEPTQGQINYDRPEKAISALRSRGVHVRGHNIVWGVQANVPQWQLSMTGTQIQTEVSKRISDVVNRFRDRLFHWDVNNEQVHGDFYEEKTQDPYYTHDMCHQIHQVDPSVQLFYNDYSVVSGGDSTYPYTWSVKKAVEMGAPVYGMGIQGHFTNWFDGNNNVQVQMIWERLEVAGSAGLPIWITELDVENTNLQARADAYESLMRLFFSHPSVEGVVLWGFWDQIHWRPDAALFEGNDLTPNAAGNRYIQLVKQTWRTSATLRPYSASQKFQLRGFHGDYQVNVTYKGQQISSQQFTLPKGNCPVVVNMQI